MACQTACMMFRVTDWAEVNGECINGDMGVQTYQCALRKHWVGQGRIGLHSVSLSTVFCSKLMLSVKDIVTIVLQVLNKTCCCILRGPSGERIVDVLQEGWSSNLRLRWEVGQAAQTRSNPHVQCTGVYCAWIVNNSVDKWTVLSLSPGILGPFITITSHWSSSFIQAACHHLRYYAESNWSTRQLLLHLCPHTLLSW